MFKRKFWFTGIAAVFFLGLSGLNTVRADVPGWFWNTLFTWAASVTDEVDALEAEVVALELLAQNALGTAVTAQNEAGAAINYAAAAQVVADAAQVSAYAAQAEIGALEAQVVALEAQVTALLAYLEVDMSDPLKPVVRIVGANFQVVNGLGNTETKNGVGNLIVGYDEDASPFDDKFCSDGSYADESTCLLAGGTWAVSQKSGSHYIVGGMRNSYTQSGGLVVGILNISNAVFSSVSGGRANTASGQNSSVSGGWFNAAPGDYASVSGGSYNTASGNSASVSGGQFNDASGSESSVSGGLSNTASGTYDWVAGSLWEDD